MLHSPCRMPGQQALCGVFTSFLISLLTALPGLASQVNPLTSSSRAKTKSTGGGIPSSLAVPTLRFPLPGQAQGLRDTQHQIPRRFLQGSSLGRQRMASSHMALGQTAELLARTQQSVTKILLLGPVEFWTYPQARRLGKEQGKI